MKRFAVLTAVAVVSAGMFVAAGGCQNKTESQKTQEKANMMESAADMIRRGEQDVADGAAMAKRGEKMKIVGDTDAGEKLISEGRALEKSGNLKIQEGKRLRDIAD